MPQVEPKLLAFLSMITCATFQWITVVTSCAVQFHVWCTKQQGTYIESSGLGSAYIPVLTLPLCCICSRQVHQFVSVVGHLFAQWSH